MLLREETFSRDFLDAACTWAENPRRTSMLGNFNTFSSTSEDDSKVQRICIMRSVTLKNIGLWAKRKYILYIYIYKAKNLLLT